MKRLIAFACVVAVMLSICGCGNTKEKTLEEASPCVLKKENGKFYLYFSEESMENANLNNVNTQIAIRSPTFSSVAELKTAVETGNFSKENLAILQDRAINRSLEIADPGKFYDAILPTGLETEKIVWGFTYYGVNINWGTNKFGTGAVVIDMEGDYHDAEFERSFVNYKSGAKTPISDRIIEDRNAREFIYTVTTGKYKMLLYQIENGDRLLYVRELYCLDYNEPEYLSGYMSETIPRSIRIFCKEEDVSWFAYFSNFEERPSIEWLTSFGVKKLAE